MRKSNKRYESIVIGVSAGGVEAIDTIFSNLPGDFSIPIIIVQHIHSTSDCFLPLYFDNQYKLSFRQAEEKEKIVTGKVYIAPPGYHLLIEEDKAFSLSVDRLVNYSRPSIDVLFETAAEAYMDKLIGIILTGANSDGSQGLKKIKESGGLTIVQNPETAINSTMPNAAISACKVDFILDIKDIPCFLMDFLESPDEQRY